MSLKNLHASATNVTGIKDITYRDSYGQAAATAEVTCTGHSLGIGDVASVVMGFSDNYATMITNGYVKTIVARRPQNDYVITIADKLSLAVDYFMAADNPDSPFMASNISGEQLVTNILAQAGITGITTEATGFTFATQKPQPINYISAWNACESISGITGFSLYTTPGGVVKFVNRKPYIMGGDTSIATLTTGGSGQITDIAYTKSDEKIRNRIVVNGSAGINAVASASSPYLPSGFYKTLPIVHELIDTTAQAQSTADLNLTMFNRLTETVRVTCVGNPAWIARTILSVTESFTGLSAAQFFVFGSTHTISNSGYSVSLTLVR